MKKTLVKTFLVMILFTTTVLSNDTPNEQYYYYGSIAFSKATGYTGGSWDYSSERDAANAAIRSCGQSDSEAVLIFWNTCGAIAVGNSGGWGGGYGSEMSIARGEALNTCQRYGNTNCRVAYSVCTTR